MDARSLFFTLAIVFILWLIRTWVKWDIEEKAASQSRFQLKQRLNDTILRERVGAGRATQLHAQTATTGIAAGLIDEDDSIKYAQRKSHLQELIIKLEAQAKATEQSDLELRRLKSELSSVQIEQSTAENQLDTLELRIREQQAALEQNTLQPGTGSESVYSQSDNAESESLEKASSTELGRKEISTKSAATKQPLYQAPSDKDNLKLIKGIGPVMERTLNELGVTTFRQLANFTQVDIDKVSEAIGAFPGRIERDDWVGKAREFVNTQRTT